MPSIHFKFQIILVSGSREKKVKGDNQVSKNRRKIILKIPISNICCHKHWIMKIWGEQFLEGEQHATPNALGIFLDSLPYDFGAFLNSCLR